MANIFLLLFVVWSFFGRSYPPAFLIGRGNFVLIFDILGFIAFVFWWSLGGEAICRNWLRSHEVSLLQALDHPYIVQLVDVFVHYGVAMYLVMELLHSGTTERGVIMIGAIQHVILWFYFGFATGALVRVVVNPFVAIYGQPLMYKLCNWRLMRFL